MPAAAHIGALPEADILKELLWLHDMCMCAHCLSGRERVCWCVCASLIIRRISNFLKNLSNFQKPARLYQQQTLGLAGSRLHRTVVSGDGADHLEHLG